MQLKYLKVVLSRDLRGNSLKAIYATNSQFAILDNATVLVDSPNNLSCATEGRERRLKNGVLICVIGGRRFETNERYHVHIFNIFIYLRYFIGLNYCKYGASAN